ncbi:hypothetical protein [Candidatus Methanoperedens nitratireducens]|uniref:Uncharacterized protein n=1 Tax=Candidatus Methanoperedens nitratireducens TaxID=1392998 RepID=A0A284VS54_9EURY|nr:hypothetical protein [Candidatus Methanoperedens nitroreducens]SNQ62038.1 hypothetical protein MNV_560084 [Candidatus Methanoperedens nitroreducens]
MDIFDVLTAISKRKKAFMCSGINEHDALIKAQVDVSKEYHISLSDIKWLAGREFRNSDHRHSSSFSV